jgi:ABC-type oligopeptide transport system substrate-binding subunit
VELAATDYNKFQQKMHAGTYQVFTWGWVADYPDAENFLFLLYGQNSSKYGDRKPNSSRFENARYDALFKRMETLRNDESATWTDGETVTRTRSEIIKEMIGIVEQECPWIPINHRETYFLYHQWLRDVKPYPMSDSMTRYYSIEREERVARREEWNRPIRWPAVVLVAGLLLFLVPGILTIRKERR